jgi:hypothetical protein
METNAKITTRTQGNILKNKNKDQNKQTHADCKNTNKGYKQYYKKIKEPKQI